MILAALSVQDFIDKVGAYVGFAAAIGLALFALLLFSQARELKRLREWGAQAHDRMGELERRLAAALELARRASSAQRTTAPAAKPAAVAQRPVAASAARAGAPALARTSAPTRLPLLPAAPVGVAGAALGSATVLVPLPQHPPPVAPAPASSPVPSAPVPPPAAEPAAPAAIPAAATAATAAAAPTTAAPAPATAAARGPAQPTPPPPAPAPAPPAGTNGHSDTFPPVPPVRRPPPAARASASRRPVARPAARPGQRPAAAAPLRARSVPSAAPRGTADGGDGTDAPHGRRRLPLLLAGLGLAAVAAVAAIALSGGGDSDSPPASGTTPAQQTTDPGGGTGVAPAHDRITVAVLNGTATPGLAQTLASELVADGFVQGTVDNASDQGRSVTVVSYFGGHEAEAREVASTLNVPSDAVQPIDADTEAACALKTGACTATVVVTVGADRQ